MRQVATFTEQPLAERFLAFLVTQGVAAQVEPEGGGWAVWVRDEDLVERARQAWEEFVGNPTDERYQDVVREAQLIAHQEVRRRAAAQKNLIEMRGRWALAGKRKNPLVKAILFLCVAVFVLSGFGHDTASVTHRVLGFCDTMQRTDWDENRTADRLVDIRHGEVWRLLTPVFLHGSVLHLAFNLWLFHMFGSMIEDRRGTGRLALLLLVIALVSNLAQGLAPGTWGQLGGTPFFVGLSGVVYGLLGYLWMKSVYEPGAGMFVSSGTVAFLMVWMFLCLSGILDRGLALASGGEATPSIANVAHVMGLLVGLALGYAPVLWRRLTPRA